MELMSSALLCVLVALLPQTLVKARNKNTFTIETMSNISSTNRQNPLRRQILLNINGPPLVSDVSQLQSVFNDNACKSCIECMDKAVKSYNHHIKAMYYRPSGEEFRNDVLTNEVEARNQMKVRPKRDIQPTPQAIVDVPKKGKTKKNKVKKAVTVTKYDIDGKVYALKVKETQFSMDQQNEKTSDGTCQVYSVKKSLPCESSDGEGLLQAAKRKANRKKSRKDQEKKVMSTPDMPTPVTTHTSFKKREVDNSQVPENVMPSIEDFF